MAFDPSLFNTAAATFSALITEFEAVLGDTQLHIDPQQNWIQTTAGTIPLLNGINDLLSAVKTSFINLEIADPLTGLGSPNGVITANPGTLYCNINGGTGNTLWVKEVGTDSNGWVAK